MCILRFHAGAIHLHHYQALLKELNHQVPNDAEPQDEPQDQYALERVTLIDQNHYLPSETCLRFLSLVAMFNQHYAITNLGEILLLCINIGTY